MDITNWLPFMPIYPNVQIPQTQQSTNRVVEPATRSAVILAPVKDWQERVEELREAHRNIAVISYGPDGNREIPPIKSGAVFDFYT
jgi:hypothetical protein